MTTNATVTLEDRVAGGVLPLPDSDLIYISAFLNRTEADECVRALVLECRWRQHTIRVAGKQIASPRLSAWYGDRGVRYTYSGLTLEATGWPQKAGELRRRVEDATGGTFNSVLANYYRNGRDSMGWHADNEPELGPEPLIASLSLGGERRFLMRHRTKEAPRGEFILQHGSLLVMAGSTQTLWRHALPKTRTPVPPRVNLTFRRIAAT